MENKFISEFIKKLPLGYACYKIVFDHAMKAEDGILLDMNQACEDITGLKAESACGHKMTELFPFISEDDCVWLATFGRVVSTGKPEEINHYSKQGDRWFKITAFSTGEVTLVTVLQDITAEMRNIKALEKQQKEILALSSDLEMIFNSTQDAMFLLSYDNGEFRYLRNNKAHQLLTGIPTGDINGKSPVELLGKDTGNKIRAGFQRCVDAGENIIFEEIIDLPTDSIVSLSSLTPVLENNEVKYIIGSRRDIRPLKALEKERAYLLQWLESMFNEHLAVMILFDPHDGCILDANPSACAFYGYTRNELLAMRIQDICALAEHKKREAPPLEAVQRYQVCPQRLKNGELRLVDIYTCPITIGNESIYFSIIFDATDRERVKDELHREKELLSITLDSIGDGVVTTDYAGNITLLNKAAQEITGWGNKEAKSRPFIEILPLSNEETGKPAGDPITKVLQTGKIVGLANHTVLMSKEGRLIPIADSAAPIKDKENQIFGVVMVFRDVSNEKKHQEQLLYLSYHDSLTGLCNRRFIEQKMKELDVDEQLPLAVIMGDVNGLKITNDVFSHDAGDKLLQRVAKIIKENCRQDDIVARWGGDEFMILLPRTTSFEAERIIQEIKQACAMNRESTLQLSISLGCAVKQFPEENIQRIIHDAEEWMYHQKLLEGKNYRNSIINALLSTLYEKSSETEEHAERLKIYCHAVGKELKLSSEEMNELSLLAILHDIGKVGIHQHILQKPGPLTSDEWTEMKRHPEIGYRIAQNASELTIVADLILSHHERWDGSGYPRGLRREEIPLLCRILAVADAYDAMTNDRVYRKALSKEEAIAELGRNAGTQFEPHIVHVFCKTIAGDSVRLIKK